MTKTERPKCITTCLLPSKFALNSYFSLTAVFHRLKKLFSNGAKKIKSYTFTRIYIYFRMIYSNSSTLVSNLKAEPTDSTAVPGRYWPKTQIKPSCYYKIDDVVNLSIGWAIIMELFNIVNSPKHEEMNQTWSYFVIWKPELNRWQITTLV